jgi:holo-[acyl-carrier protein] synthase
VIRRRGGAYSAGSSAPRVVTPANRAALYGVGVDLLQVSRLAQVQARHPERFARRLLHPLEMQRLESLREAQRDPVNFLAKCFAVKEAFVKALGTGFRGIAHDEVGWVRGALGKPELVFSPKVEAVLRARGIGARHVSITDEIDFVCVVVTLERC